MDNPCLPQISISTTLSAGEFSNFAGATDEERKVKDLYTGDGLWVSAAFLDPVVTTATPGWLWASTGIRAVDHAIETVCSRISFPFSDGLALEALRLLRQHLPRSTSDRNDLESAGYCQVAAWMSIYNLTNVQVGLSHGLGHQLGARNDVPHGVTSCIMLPPGDGIQPLVDGPATAADRRGHGCRYPQRQRRRGRGGGGLGVGAPDRHSRHSASAQRLGCFQRLTWP